MQTSLIAVGRRMPAWVKEGTEQYTRRLPKHWGFTVRELNASTEASAELAMAREGDSVLAAVREKSHLVALDSRGKSWSTEQLAGRLEHWLSLGKPLAFCIGGAEGLHDSVRERADELWSLSPLTLPHPLVRVVVVEQLYRAHTVLINHPYHRA